MSYGNYSRFGSGYSSFRPGSNAFPSSSSRRSNGGLSPSFSFSYLSPNACSRGSSLKTLSSPTGYELTNSKSASSIRGADLSRPETHSERSRQRYGSSVSLPDSEVSSKSDTSSRYSSRGSLIDEDKDYKKLYEEVKKENDRLKEDLKKSEDELEKAKKQTQKLSQSSTMKNSISEAEKKEKRSLERKLSEMEEEIKQNEKLVVDNKRLKEENAALIRVISKLSQ